MAAENQNKSGFHLSREVSVTDIAGLLLLGIPALIWAAKVDERLVNVERTLVVGRQERLANEARQDTERDRLRLEIKADLDRINAKLDQLIINGRSVR
jgi:hypothetical protein